MQVGWQGVPRRCCQHPVEARIGRIGGSPLRASSIRTPTAPGVRFQLAMTSSTAGLAGSTGLTRANLLGMAGADLDRVARIVVVHRVGRDQDRAVDTGGVQCATIWSPVTSGGPASFACHGRPGWLRS